MRQGTGWSLRGAVCSTVVTVSCPVCHKRRPPLPKEVAEWPPRATCSAACSREYQAKLTMLMYSYEKAKGELNGELCAYSSTYEWYPEYVVQYHYDTAMVKGRAA